MARSRPKKSADSNTQPIPKLQITSHGPALFGKSVFKPRSHIQSHYWAFQILNAMALKIWSQLRRINMYFKVQGWKYMAVYISVICLCACLCVFSGGRKIVVTGSGFDQVQRATMRVLPSSDEFSHKSSNVEVRVMFVIIIFGPFYGKVCGHLQ